MIICSATAQDLPGILAIYNDVIAAPPIEISHMTTAVTPEPATRDPFDRLLLAQCRIEDTKLLTPDHVLAAHPLAWTPHS